MKVQILKFGTPEIFNTDQGSRFTADDFTDALSSRGIRISMDGRGRFLDSIFIERLLGSVKYEGVYFKAYDRSLMLEGNSHPTSSSTTKGAGTRALTIACRKRFTGLHWIRCQRPNDGRFITQESL